VLLILHLAAAAEAKGSPDPLMIGHGLGLERVRQVVARVADRDVPVLVRGETGSGKELVARALHQGSRRRAGPFVSVNLGAVPRELAAAELFGAVRGAYTGVTRDRDGLFRAAHGGTLFLDEVGEAPPEVQVLLLRVLETGELYPVGGNTPVPIDVRVIAATDADLEEHIRAGRFKAPLLHRLAGYEVRVPPLRERREDIGLLLVHFARAELQATGEEHRLRPEDPRSEPWLGAELASLLVRYHWPGNIRQLRNMTRQLVIASRGLPQLSLDPRLAAELKAAGAPPDPPPPALEPATPQRARRRPADVSEAELLEALRAASWDLRAAADRLGIARPSIYDLVERHPHLHIAGDLDAAEIRRAFDDCGGDVNAMVERLRVSRRALRRRLRELGLG
jgi:two-component system nitrogen regulation response regulator GlnG